MRNPVKTAKRQLLRVGSCALSALMVLGSIPAAAIGDGVTATYDEAYYAMTDYYGNLTDGSVVKSYRTNGIATLTDYGDYDEIINLTDGTAPTRNGGKTTFQLDEKTLPGAFYFEGKTAKPFQQLPWTISMSYTLNGVPTKAEDLAGKAGVVEIRLDIVPNEQASEYARNNYTLEAMAIFNQDDILSLEAPGAQVQLIGNLRAVLFLGLPGEECHYTIRVGSEDFSFGGMTFMMVPATLSQLEEIAKLSERKDDLEDNYNKLSDSLDVLLDSMNGISGSLYATANGLDKLNQARDTFSKGKGTLYEQADTLQESLGGLQSALDLLPDHIDKAAIAVDDTDRALKNLNGALRDAQDELKDIQDDLNDIQDYLNRMKSASEATAGDLKALGAMADQLAEDAGSFFQTLAELKLGVGSEEITMQGKTMAEINALLKQAEIMEGAYRIAGGTGNLSEDQFIFGAMIAQKVMAAYTADNTIDLKDAMISAEEEAKSEIATFKETTGKIQALATANGLSFDDAIDLFFDAVEAQMAAAGDPAAATKAAAMKTQYTTALGQMNGLKTVFAATSSGGEMNEEQFFTALIMAKGGSANPKKDAQDLLHLYEQTKNTTDTIMPLCDLLGKKNGVAGSTAKLLQEVANTLSQLNEISDHADDMLDDLDDVLDAMDDLYDVFHDNAPGLKTTLEDIKSMVGSLSKTVGNTNTFMGTFESLLKDTGSKLDTGTKETLEGLAAALRATARSLSTTGDVKDAKHNISNIIEDTWDEYTGDMNNLLLMDATAEAVSLTDSRNPSPESIQILIRTQEITMPDEDETEAEAAAEVQTTFWGRVAQMFKDFWAAITGLFGGKD